jgi:hypothetical protein
VKKWNGLVWVGIGPLAVSWEDGNEPSGSINGGKFLDYPTHLIFHEVG